MTVNKFTGILTAIFIAGVLTVSLIQDAAKHKTEEQPLAAAKNTITDGSAWLVSPEPLIEGKNNAKLKPLVGSMSGAVAVHYRGPRSTVAVSIEYWKGGAKTQTLNGLSMTLMDQEKDKQGNYVFDGHIVYSLQDRYDPNGGGIAYRELVYAIVSPNGYASSTFKVDIPVGIKMWSGIHLPQEIKVPLDESTTVWGLQGTDKQQMSSYSSPTETLLKADWAMAVRLGFNDSNHNATK